MRWLPRLEQLRRIAACHGLEQAVLLGGFRPERLGYERRAMGQLSARSRNRTACSEVAHRHE
jgi:hypothetical protein